MSAVAPPIGRRVRWVYGFGSVAYGVKDNGFSFLLMIFYSQVLGLSPALAGLALFLALIFDAISDPLVGFWSDSTRSRWGRRHPFMYFSALPVAVCYYFLWSPPIDISNETHLFFWLLGSTIGVRFLITLYEIPSTSLVAELTADYDDRTRLLGYRYMFGWYGGLTMHFLAFAVFLADSEAFPSGVLDPSGYSTYGLVAAIMIFLSIVISSAGLHDRIPYLHQVQVRKPRPLKQVASDLRDTLSNRNFLALFFAAVVSAVATGVSTNFNLYINTYFWEFRSADIQWITASLFVSAVVAMFLAPVMTARWDKKKSAMIVYAVAMVWFAMPVTMRLLGFWPSNDSTLLLPLMVFHQSAEVTMLVIFGIVQSSMLADIVEENELRYGRREEGLFFAARTFALKATSGVGTLLAGIILQVIQFPRGVAAGEVPAEALFKLGVIYGPVLAVLFLTALIGISFYRITRRDHADNLDIIARRESELDVQEALAHTDNIPGLPTVHPPELPDLGR